MTNEIRPGARVRVGIPKAAPCSLHCLNDVPVLEATGTVDRIEASRDYPIVVMFDSRHLGVQWVDRFTSDELVPA